MGAAIVGYAECLGIGNAAPADLIRGRAPSAAREPAAA